MNRGPDNSHIFPVPEVKKVQIIGKYIYVKYHIINEIIIFSYSLILKGISLTEGECNNLFNLMA